MIEERIAVLRTLEADCYSVCFYLLQEEQSAAAAAQAALTEIYRDPVLCLLPEKEREQRAFRMALKTALNVRKQPRPNEKDFDGDCRRSL